MRLTVIALALILTGCTDQAIINRIRGDLVQLGECVCAGKGGISYLKIHPYSHSAYVLCAASDKEYSVSVGDYCKRSE